jgi:AcrR family transcriptional regulator
MSESAKRAAGRPRSDESEAALLDAAYWRILDEGYGALTVDAIAKAAGAGKQTLYRRWPSKAALAIEALAGKMAGRIDRPRETAIRAGDLTGFLKAEFAATKPFARSLAPLAVDAQSDPETARAFRDAFLKPRQSALRSILALSSPDPETRDALAEAIDGAIWRRVLLAEPLDEDFARRLGALLRTQT